MSFLDKYVNESETFSHFQNESMKSLKHTHSPPSHSSSSSSSSSFRAAHTFEKAAVESVRRLHVGELDALRLPLCHAHPGRPIGGARDTRLAGDAATSPNGGAKHRAPTQHPNTDT